ncbi:MAG: hypothetical protein NVSMB65_00580 [Chloroflexota bacterium]
MEATEPQGSPLRGEALADPPVVARMATTARELRALLLESGLPAEAEVYVVKPTWHGRAPGTYTDAQALGLLLEALRPGRAVVVEGYTSGRNDGSRAVDWSGDPRPDWDWIREQDDLYLRQMGLAAEMERHGARYVSVTEEVWSGRVAPPDEVEALVRRARGPVAQRELYGLVPRCLYDLRGAPLISMARFKGTMRMSTMNLFGLIPDPLRVRWHGEDDLGLMRTMVDLALLYGGLFRLHGMVEALSAAVHWRETGAHRSRWGRYDVVEHPGVVVAGPHLGAVDAYGELLQGIDPTACLYLWVAAEALGAWRLPGPEAVPAALSAALDPDGMARTTLLAGRDRRLSPPPTPHAHTWGFLPTSGTQQGS